MLPIIYLHSLEFFILQFKFLELMTFLFTFLFDLVRDFQIGNSIQQVENHLCELQGISLSWSEIQHNPQMKRT